MTLDFQARIIIIKRGSAIVRATTTSYPKKCRKDYSFMNHFEAVTIVSKQYKPIANASSGTPQSFM